jgi:hypothetical protein
LEDAVSKLAEAQQRAVDLFELAETQRCSTVMQEASKAESTLARARMQQIVAETLAKQVALLEQTKAFPLSIESNPGSSVPPAIQQAHI